MFFVCCICLLLASISCFPCMPLCSGFWMLLRSGLCCGAVGALWSKVPTQRANAGALRSNAQTSCVFPNRQVGLFGSRHKEAYNIQDKRPARVPECHPLKHAREDQAGSCAGILPELAGHRGLREKPKFCRTKRGQAYWQDGEDRAGNVPKCSVKDSGGELCRIVAVGDV